MFALWSLARSVALLVDARRNPPGTAVGCALRTLLILPTAGSVHPHLLIARLIFHLFTTICSGECESHELRGTLSRMNDVSRRTCSPFGNPKDKPGTLDVLMNRDSGRALRFGCASCLEAWR